MKEVAVALQGYAQILRDPTAFQDKGVVPEKAEICEFIFGVPDGI